LKHSVQCRATIRVVCHQVVLLSTLAVSHVIILYMLFVNRPIEKIKIE